MNKIWTCGNEKCFMHGCNLDRKVRLRKKCWICHKKTKWMKVDE